jgi:glycosyltransferase involved in cell wall biosynthesis
MTQPFDPSGLRIVFFLNILRDGAGMVNRELGFAKELVKRGSSVHILSYFKPQMNPGDAGIAVCGVLPLPYFRFLYETLVAWPLARVLIFRRLKKLAPDIVCVDLPHEAYWALKFRRRLNYRVLFTYHGVDDPRYYSGKQAEYFKGLREKHNALLPRADQVVIVSDYLLEEVHEIGVEPVRIYNGVEHDVYRPDRKITATEVVAPLVLSLNRYTESKGVFSIVKAFRRALEKIPNAELVCYGIQDDPDYINRIKTFIREEGIEDRVYVFGPVDAAEMPYRMAEATLFANAALYESFGMPMAEAQACGTPCVAFAIQGIPEVVLDRQTGLLAPANDLEKYAENIVEILEHPALCKQFSENAVQHAKQFDYTQLVEQLIPVLGRLKTGS